MFEPRAKSEGRDRSLPAAQGKPLTAVEATDLIQTMKTSGKADLSTIVFLLAARIGESVEYYRYRPNDELKGTGTLVGFRGEVSKRHKLCVDIAPNGKAGEIVSIPLNLEAYEKGDDGVPEHALRLPGEIGISCQTNERMYIRFRSV